MSLIASSRMLLPSVVTDGDSAVETVSLVCPIEFQEKTYWCWAAVGVSLANFYQHPALKQCELARSMMGGDCCGSKNCNQPWLLEKVLGGLGVDVLATMYPRALTFSEVVDEIDDGRPVGVRIALTGAGAHYVVISGYDSSSRMLDIGDPEKAYGAQRRTHDVLLNSYRGTWTHSFTTRP